MVPALRATEVTPGCSTTHAVPKFVPARAGAENTDVRAPAAAVSRLRLAVAAQPSEAGAAAKSNSAMRPTTVPFTDAKALNTLVVVLMSKSRRRSVLAPLLRLRPPECMITPLRTGPTMGKVASGIDAFRVPGARAAGVSPKPSTAAMVPALRATEV